MSQESVDRLFYHLNHRRDAPAFSLGDEVYTFGELDERGRRYAVGLRALGVEQGDRVVSILDSSLELAEVLVGHHRMGAVHVPVNTRYRSEEISHIVDDAQPTAIVVSANLAARDIIDKLKLPDTVNAVIVVGDDPRGDEFAYEQVVADRPLQNLPELHDDDLALFIYTSGTTGPSKGVMHTFDSVVSGIGALTDHWRWSTEDKLVLALPLFHVHGLCIGVHGTLIQGNQTEIHRRFDAEEVAKSVGDGGTIFMGVPTMHTRIAKVMEQDQDLADAMGQARLITSGSAALRPDVFEAYQELTGHRILERYGMSETMLTITNPYTINERRRGAVGFAVPGTEVRIVDEEGEPVEDGEVGEIQVRGPSVMCGYWGLEDKTEASFTEEGFFRTGDVARRDDDGYIYIVGRRSVDIIKSGGFKISAREIEEVLRQHPEVDDIGVVGIPDEQWGEKIAAAVVPEEGVERSGERWLQELGEVADGKLADYKKPLAVYVYEQGLPRNALGKVQKHRIVENEE